MVFKCAPGKGARRPGDPGVSLGYDALRRRRAGGSRDDHGAPGAWGRRTSTAGVSARLGPCVRAEKGRGGLRLKGQPGNALGSRTHRTQPRPPGWSMGHMGARRKPIARTKAAYWFSRASGGEGARRPRRPGGEPLGHDVPGGAKMSRGEPQDSFLFQPDAPLPLHSPLCVLITFWKRENGVGKISSERHILGDT